jgi:hypothetical protein
MSKLVFRVCSKDFSPYFLDTQLFTTNLFTYKLDIGVKMNVETYSVSQS